MGLVLYIVLVLLVLYTLKYIQVWAEQRRTGLPGPLPPLPYFGAFFHIFNGASKQHIQYAEMTKKYGRVAAMTLYDQVHILVSDPQVVKGLFVKNADCFGGIAHQGLKLNTRPYSSMISVSGDRWRCIRNTVSPIFTTSMIKHTMELMQDTLATFMNKVRHTAEESKKVDAHVFTKQAVMEIMVKKSYSVDAKCQTDKDDPFMKSQALALKSVRLVQLMASLPFSAHLFSLMGDPGDLDYMLWTAKQVIKEHRQGSGGDSRDFVKLLLQTQENIDDDKKLSEDEILANSLIFPLAGVESTSSAAAYLLYTLALYPEVQEKVRAEVDQVWKDGETLTYDMVSQTPYLDMVYQETQRLYSLGHQSTRLCIQDCEIAGVKFRKGNVVIVPICVIHNDPEFWPEPEKFIPERFTPEEKNKRDPYVFLPFSHGPRNCVGLRLANVVTKSIAMSVLKEYVVTKTEEMMIPLKLECFFGLILPPGSTTVKFLRRPKH